jgi:RNA polymerase sigma factor (sigma-70 family)
MADDIKTESNLYVENLYSLVRALVWKQVVLFDEKGEYQDIVQEVLRRLLEPQHLERLRSWSSSQWSGFLKRMVRNILINLKRERRRLSCQEGPSETEAPDTCEPEYMLLEQEALLLSRELRKLAREAMTEEQYTVFELRLAGKSHNEISTALGISEGASRKALHDGIKSLIKKARERGWL